MTLPEPPSGASVPSLHQNDRGPPAQAQYARRHGTHRTQESPSSEGQSRVCQAHESTLRRTTTVRRRICGGTPRLSEHINPNDLKRERLLSERPGAPGKLLALPALRLAPSSSAPWRGADSMLQISTTSYEGTTYTIFLHPRLRFYLHKRRYDATLFTVKPSQMRFTPIAKQNYAHQKVWLTLILYKFVGNKRSFLYF